MRYHKNNHSEGKKIVIKMRFILFFLFLFDNKSTPIFLCQQKISELNGLILVFPFVVFIY